MGHYCRSCGRIRANEKFSGRGHRQHVCQDCQRRPRAEREQIDRLDELRGFLAQSIISKKNQARLRVLCLHQDPQVRALAVLLQDIAAVRPGRRRRLSFLAQHHWPLFARMVALLGDAWWDERFCYHCDDPDDDRVFSPYERAKLAQHANTSCWCGSGLPYWNCCADRDDSVSAAILPEDATSPDLGAALDDDAEYNTRRHK